MEDGRIGGREREGRAPSARHLGWMSRALGRRRSVRLEDDFEVLGGYGEGSNATAIVTTEQLH